MISYLIVLLLLPYQPINLIVLVLSFHMTNFITMDIVLLSILLTISLHCFGFNDHRALKSRDYVVT